MGTVLLLVTALIWGVAFLAQKLGMDHIGPFLFTVLRNVLGGLFVLGAIACRGPAARAAARAFPLRESIIGGVCSGAALFAATIAQQVGIMTTTPGVAAFLTSTYVLLVPILGVFIGRRIPVFVWPGAAAAVCGLYLICMNGPVPAGRGEALIVVCAALYAVQMLVVAHWAPKTDVLVFSATQFLTSAVIGLPFVALPSESALLTREALAGALPAVAFCGILSSGVAYTLQNVAQARTPAAVAGIVLSLESVFGALAGYVFLGDALSPRQLLGCGLVFASVVATQLFEIRSERNSLTT